MPDGGRLLLVMAKVPRAGAVKTRLCPPLTPGLAADLYRAFLRDTLATGAGLAGVALGVVYPPVDDARALRALLPPGATLWPQEGQGLGAGLGGAFARAFALGYRRVAIVSSDSPTLPPAVLEEAFAALDDHDLVLGPTLDGGYYLIGLTAPRPELFDGIAWSTPAVYGQTLARAADLGLRVHATPAWHDVDGAADLAPLAAHCADGAAPHTAAMLGNAALGALLREAGVGLPGVAGPDGAQPWDTLGVEWLLRSPWRSLRRDRVRLHTGAEIAYSYLETPRAVWVVPLTPAGEIVLIRQYRYPVRAWVWEVPAGAIGDEAPVEAARRELAEEIGGRCRELRAVGRFYSSSAHLTLEAHVFLALDVELARADREMTELLDIVALPADEAFARARSGAIDEGQSALALLMAEPLVRVAREGAGA
ncbi:MAG TPA: TIGR04282 family arsenosugar biosynthesis glycosyltransferase [Thermomicrobiales bacterium]|nr:TIGR04282 family arsenosugar biosynthesis glycosyltransferase [Thermomicrobiales bacterium]